MIQHKIYPVEIPEYRDSTQTRYFLEVKTPDGRWHDVGNSESESEMRERLEQVVIVGNSWTLK